MDINVKSKFGLRGVNRKNSYFVLLILGLLVSALFINVFAPTAEGSQMGDTYKITYENGRDYYGHYFPTGYNTGDLDEWYYKRLPCSIPDPTKHEWFPRDYDYEFLGWTVTYANGTQEFSQKSYVIPEGTTGDINLEANWASKGFWQSIKDGGLSLVVIIAAVIVLLFVGIFVLAIFKDHRDRLQDAYEDGRPVPLGGW